MKPQQKLFNKVARHLLKQGTASIARYMKEGEQINGCAYRGDDGTRCAVGCLITNREYRRGFEGQSIDELLEEGHLPRLRRNVRLLKELQAIHDNAAPSYWLDDLREVALDFHLSTAVLEEFKAA